MALLADDALDALRVQMDHTAAVAAKPTYPLAPTVAPKEPVWTDSASGGYYDDGLGHYSNNGGASWDYTPPSAGNLAGMGDAFQSLFSRGMPSTPTQPAPVSTEPTWNPSGYYDDGLGHASYDGGASWVDSPTQAVAAVSNFGNAVTPQFTPENVAQRQQADAEAAWAPTQQQFVDIDRGMDTTSGAGQGFFSGTNDPYAQWRNQWADEGRVDPYDPRINPETAREATYGSASNGGNPFTVVAQGGLTSLGVPFAKPIGAAIGTLADAATFGAGSAMAGGNEDVTSKGFWGEAGMAAGNAGFFGLGGGLVRNAAANVGANLAGEYIPKGLEKYSETGNVGSGIAGNPYVQTGAGLLGAVAAGVGGYGAGGAVVGTAKRAPGVVKAADRALATTNIGTKLAGETGALDMGAVSDIASAARRSPVGRAVAKVTPGGMEVTPGPLGTGTRVGDILHAPILDEAATPKQVLVVDRNLTRRVASASNQIDAEAAPAWKALGKTFTDDNGNVYLKDVAPSQAEIERGLPGALAVRVIEKPGEYALTPAQAKAVTKLGALTDRVANERDLLGAPVNRLTGEEGDIYQHRKALKPSEATQAEALVAEKDPRANELYSGGGGSSRLAIGKDKSRIYADPADAVRDGVVYADPKTAFNENVSASLTKAKNAHIKTLLEPFGQTSADRISPEFRAVVDDAKNIAKRLEGRLATAEKRANINSARGTDLATMLEKQATGAAQRVDAAPSEIAVLNRFLTRAQNRIVELRQRGGAYADEARALDDMLADARANVDELLPKWETAKEVARSVPPGRRSIPHDMAPALIGTDFDKETAARIISQYGGGIRVGNKVMETKLPGVKAVNAILHPINATLDFSVTLNQLAILGVSNKREFAANLVRSMRDMVDDTNYNKWLADPKTADSARWVTIYGHTGDQGDFLARGLEKIPGIAQTQKQFARFGNRMRVAALDSIADSAAKSAGRELDDTAMEQIGRAVDRLSGVSMSRATDAEGIAQFAPNFFRSIIETTAHAVSDGGLEGQIARQYLKNYAALGAGLVTATAIAQNRDLGEVLNPFDKKAWERGQIKINPNWMTIRVAGQDISVFGAYDSAIKLLVVGADAGFRSIKEQDANQLFDALGYAAGSKGSAPVKFITDLIKGETWGGGDPMSPVEIGKRALPISAQQAVQSAQEGESVKDIAINTGLSMLGAKANPVTDYEKKDKQARDAYGRPWDQLSPVEQNALKAIPGSPAATYESSNPDAVASQKRKAADRTEMVGYQSGVDTAYIDPLKLAPKTPNDGKAWRDEYHIGVEKQQTQYEKDERDFPYTGPESKDPTRAALAERGALMEANKVGSKINWDVIDAWSAANPEKQKLIDAYFADPNKPNTDLTPAVTAYKAASKAVGDSGLFDIRDQSWATLQKNAPYLKQYASYEDYQEAATAAVVEQMVKFGKTEEEATQLAPSVMAGNAIVQAMSDLNKAGDYTWIRAHPKEAMLAVQWGYISGKEKIAFIQSLNR